MLEYIFLVQSSLFIIQLDSVSTFNMYRWIIITEFYFRIIRAITKYLS